MLLLPGRARPGLSLQDVRPGGLAGCGHKIHSLVTKGEIVLEHIARRHPPGQSQIWYAALHLAERRGYFNPHHRFAVVQGRLRCEGATTYYPSQRRRCARPRPRGRVAGESGLDRRIAQPPVHLQAVTGQSAVDGIRHLAVVVDVVTGGRHPQLAEIERGIEALQRIVGPHHPVEAAFQRFLPLRTLEQETDAAVLKARTHTGHVRVEQELTVAQADEAVTKSY